MPTLSPGDPAPSFSLTADDGSTVSLSDAPKAVLFFYPKAFTPGCTTESCDFRDNHERFLAQGYTVLGISPDPAETLARFRAEHGLPYRLLSDPDHRVAAAYGAWGTKKNYGKEYEGIIRSTFVVADGTVVEAMTNVKATGHVDRVVKAIG